MKPIVLIPSGESDADFIYATGLAVETSLYIRFGEGDDVLVTSPLEIERARVQSKAVRKLLLEEAGYEAAGPYVSYARLAARMLRERDLDSARVSPRLQAGYLEAMRAAGLEVEVDTELFQVARRRKSPAEAGFIEASQRAAEAAVVEVVSQLAQADIRDGILWLDERPLTSERLYARASLLLGERGFVCPDMIIAGSPECAMPHYRGEGPLRAFAPVIIDIFPGSRNSHYHGVCHVLVDRGYGTTTKGFEGVDAGAKMNHSTGHGVGLDVHEEPTLRGPDENILREGDVVTVEPGLYLLGLGGVRIEDTGMVTKDGFKNFTTLTRSLDPRDYL